MTGPWAPAPEAQIPGYSPEIWGLGHPVLQVMPERIERSRFLSWWYRRFPIPNDQLCRVTHWNHAWNNAWGDVTCRSCGETAYIEYGR